MTEPARRDSHAIMRAVALALLPGLLMQIAWFGIGSLLVTLTAMLAAQLTASICRGGWLLDPAALVTGALIGLALPPLAPWWVAAVAGLAAIALAREAYGGLGANLFNPAMVGYAVVLVAFPATLARWPGDAEVAGLLTTFSAFADLGAGADALDGVTGATTLEAFRFSAGLTSTELFATDSRFGSLGGAGWEWINAAYAAGGVWLLRQHIISWHAPLGLLVGIGVPALLLADGGSSSGHGGVLLHWFSGATMLCAFFIVTDPVTSPTRPADRFWLAALTGLVVYVIRAFGHYADGVAFAVLLTNTLAPLIDAARARQEVAADA